MPRGELAVELSRKKRVLFTLFTLGILWLLIDTTAYVAPRYLGSRMFVFPIIRAPTSDEQLSRFYEGSPFHARWGWDISEKDRGQFGNRRGRKYEKTDHFKMKAFGDSFTFGGSVKDSETFCYLIEEKTGWDCLNYGVVGYGTNQALLKYMDSSVNSKYVILGVLDENIERCVDTCRGLFDARQAPRPKPRFVITRNGSATLLPNPIRDASELNKLKDIVFLESLKEHN